MTREDFTSQLVEIFGDNPDVKAFGEDFYDMDKTITIGRFMTLWMTLQGSEEVSRWRRIERDDD